MAIQEKKLPPLTDAEVAEKVAPGMRIAAAWSWRILVVAAVIALIGLVVVLLRDVAVPVFVAILLSALLVPLCNLLQRKGWPKALAVAVCELSLLVVIAGLITVIILTVRRGLPDLIETTQVRYDDFVQFLAAPPLNLSEKDITSYVDDAVGIGLGAFILGWVIGEPFPLVIPIAIAVFLASFIPVVGAVATGVFAVFVALVYLGPVPALVMLGIVILVQQVEGHVLQPFLIGNAVKVHPVAVVLAVATGGFIAGIPGALFAVPLVAMLNVMIGYVARGDWRTNPHPSVADVVPPRRGAVARGK